MADVLVLKGCHVWEGNRNCSPWSMRGISTLAPTLLPELVTFVLCPQVAAYEYLFIHMLFLLGSEDKEHVLF